MRIHTEYLYKNTHNLAFREYNPLHTPAREILQLSRGRRRPFFHLPSSRVEEIENNSYAEYEKPRYSLVPSPLYEQYDQDKTFRRLVTTSEKDTKQSQTEFTTEEMTQLRRLQNTYRADGSHDEIKDLSQIATLRRQCAQSGVKVKKDVDGKSKKLSYDIAFDVFHMQQLRRRNQHDLQPGFLREVKENLRTNIQEYFSAEKNTFDLYYSHGKLYSTEFPEKPFSDVIGFGNLSLEHDGSPTVTRENREHTGFLLMEEYLYTAEEGSMMVLLSPPVPGRYTENVIIIAQKMVDPVTKKQFVRQTRYAYEALTDSRYKKIATFLQPDYFDEYDELQKNEDITKHMQLQEYYVGKPIPVERKQFADPQDLFSNLIGVIDQQKQRQISTVLQNTEPLINTYAYFLLTFLFSKASDWQQLALTFQAIMVIAESIYQGKASQLENAVYLTHDISANANASFHSTIQKPPPLLMQKITNVWGRQTFQEKLVACGSAVNLEVLQESNSVSSMLANLNFMWKNIVEGKFNKKKKENKSKEYFICPLCGYHAKGPIGNQCPKCPLNTDNAASYGFQVC